MFEALGQVSDRELMLVNLDLVDTFESEHFPPRHLNFILYNPTSETRSASLSIPPAKGGTVRITESGKAIPDALKVPSHAFLRLSADF
jgi:hypothetical protein